nr:MAG TPA: hypothetical protein [Caudoviricetes sp.]
MKHRRPDKKLICFTFLLSTAPTHQKEARLS